MGEIEQKKKRKERNHRGFCICIIKIPRVKGEGRMLENL